METGSTDSAAFEQAPDSFEAAFGACGGIGEERQLPVVTPHHVGVVVRGDLKEVRKPPLFQLSRINALRDFEVATELVIDAVLVRIPVPVFILGRSKTRPHIPVASMFVIREW